MARITVEDCLKHVDNLFELCILSTKRTKQLLSGAPMMLTKNRSNKSVVSSLREIEEGFVRFATPEDEAKMVAREERLRLAREATGGTMMFDDDANGSSGKKRGFMMEDIAADISSQQELSATNHLSTRRVEEKE